MPGEDMTRPLIGITALRTVPDHASLVSIDQIIHAVAVARINRYRRA